MRFAVVLAAICVVFRTSGAVLTANDCVTPEGLNGICITLNQCPHLLAMLSDVQSLNSTKAYLRRSHCEGFVRNMPKVCCSVDRLQTANNRLDAMEERPAPQSAVLTANDCATPEGLNGTCISLDQCPHLQAILREAHRSNSTKDKVYLQRSQCEGFVRNMPKVCCPVETTHSENDRLDAFDQSPSLQDHVVEDHVNLNSINARDCGVGETSRIVSGSSNADMYEFPWLVLLGYKDGRRRLPKFSCSGSLINSRYVLTAASCINSNLSMVRLGEYHTGLDPDCETVFGGRLCAMSSQNITVQRSFVHPGYSRSSSTRSLSTNNIALIRLNTSAELTDTVRPICLPIGVEEQDSNLFGRKMVLSGWGIAVNGSSSSEIALKDVVTIMHHEACHRYYNSQGKVVSELAVCVEPKTRSLAQLCSADPGGPLFAARTKAGRTRFMQFGVTSQAGDWCRNPESPAVFTRVGHYVQWILDTIQK